MRVELLKLHEQLGTTMIYVTHDQTEAMTLGTKIVVMKAGYIQQVGAPAKIYNNPINLFVAGFLGSPSMNFFKCRIKAEADNRVALVMEESGQGKKFYLSDPLTKRMGITANGRQVILGIRPEDIYDENGARELGIMDQTENMEEIVVNREMTGAETILYFDEQNKTHAVRLKPENKTQTGEKIKLYFDMEKIHIFDPETEKNSFIQGGGAIMGKKSAAKRSTHIFYLVPSMLIFAVFLFYPFFKTIYLSLYKTNKMGEAKLFVGLENYKALLSSPSFHNSLKVTLIFVSVVVIGSMLLGLVAAVLCNKAFPGIRFFSTAYALPMAIASSSAAMIFQIMLHPAVGIVNKLLNLDINWLNDPKTALWCVAILTAWLNSGINFCIFRSTGKY